MFTLKKFFYESTKLSSIQRNVFFDRVSKKLFSACSITRNGKVEAKVLLAAVKSRHILTRVNKWKCQIH